MVHRIVLRVLDGHLLGDLELFGHGRFHLKLAASARQVSGIWESCSCILGLDLVSRPPTHGLKDEMAYDPCSVHPCGRSFTR